LYNATLLARGHQVEPTALVMLRPATAATGPAAAASVVTATSRPPQTDLTPLLPAHLDGIKESLDTEKDEEILADLQEMASSGRAWAALDGGTPIAVIARHDGGDGVHELLDFAFARAAEPVLAKALEQAAHAVGDEGLRPAGVIDATEAARHRIFRAAGFFTAASYMVYYDPIAGRPSVARVTTAELHGIIERGEHVHLLDVLGEEHWNEGHLPGSEWIDFKGLAREARRRFKPDEPIIAYCSGFT
jgi:hypothetical protein